MTRTVLRQRKELIHLFSPFASDVVRGETGQHVRAQLLLADFVLSLMAANLKCHTKFNIRNWWL
jgi:hypothetical protein